MLNAKTMATFIWNNIHGSIIQICINKVNRVHFDFMLTEVKGFK